MRRQRTTWRLCSKRKPFPRPTLIQGRTGGAKSAPSISELARSYERATKAGEARLARQPRAAKARYDARKSRLVIELTNGVILMLPPKLPQGLKNATAAQLGKVELTPLGTGLHWEAQDADLSVARLAAGVFGSKAWMSGLARYAGSRAKRPAHG